MHSSVAKSHSNNVLFYKSPFYSPLNWVCPFVLVQSGLDLSKLVWKCWNWSRLVQIGSDLFKLVQTCSNWSEHAIEHFQIVPDLSKRVYSWNNFWTTPFLFAFLNCVSTILRGDLGGAHVRLLTPYVDAFLFVTILDH